MEEKKPNKKIIIFADGTWNTPANLEGGMVASTNVFRLFNELVPQSEQDGKKMCQLRYYTEGVGTSPGSDKFIGGLFGKGINENIIEVYRFIVENYTKGDELYFFGFSRGAYTVRSLAGLIRNCGIIKRKYHQKIERAFEIYRSRDEKDQPDSPQPKFFRDSFCHKGPITIKFLGVWDTVGSLGIPFRWFSFRAKHRFHDVELSSIVDKAYHAVSIDERRVFFRPSLWRQDPEHHHQLLEQVWFNGVHSDVGGGYPDGKLHVFPLHYLKTRARENGMAFRENPFEEQELREATNAAAHNSKDKLYYRIWPDYFRVINKENNHKLNVFQRLGVWFLNSVMADTYTLKREGEKNLNSFNTCEYLHVSVRDKYQEDSENIPENLYPVFDKLIRQKRVIDKDGKII